MAKPKLSTTLAYCIGLLLFFEVCSRIVISFNPTLFLTGDSWWRNDWIKRHLTRNIGIYYKFDIFDPTKGWHIKPNLNNEKAFGNKILNTNSKGIRGKIEYLYNKPKNKKRILVLGDSFTFGDGVSDNEIFPYYLQQMLPSAEVINFGVHGYGHDQMLIYLQEEGIKYKPDIVLLAFVYQDIHRNLLAFRDYAKPRFILRKGRLRLSNSPVPPPSVTLKKEIYRLKVFDLCTSLFRKIRNKFVKNEIRARKITSAILDEIVKTAEDINAEIIFMYAPESKHMQSDTIGWEESFLYGYCGERKINYFFLQPHFKDSEKNGVKLKEHGHWGPTEHKIAAKALADYLRNNELAG